jgi:exonuclease III
MLTVVLVLLCFFPIGAVASPGPWTDIDHAVGDAIVPISVAGGVLNIVSANISRSPARLDTINHLMSKHGWHIVLIQETGVMSDLDFDLEDRLARRITNKIFFNSPSACAIRQKQTAARLAKLAKSLQDGAINSAQYDARCAAAGGSRLYASGGLAIMVAASVAGSVRVHKVYKYLGDNTRCFNSRAMLMSLSVNGMPMCIINMYAPADGHRRVGKWLSSRLDPVVMECCTKGWSVVAGGDFNVTPSVMDHSNPANFHPCMELNNLFLNTGRFKDLFCAAHTHMVKYSWHKLARTQPA